MIELVLLGVIVGLLSGFFGIGGGAVSIPLLLMLGYDIKVAIGISVTQMVFSSTYGSYLNNKKGTLDVPMIASIGVGGAVGALFSGYIASNIDDFTLEIIFLLFVLFALLRVFFKTKEHREEKKVHKMILFLVGVPLGAISMTIGVGGSIILVPLLVSYLYVPINKATSAGLFFVVFSSIAGTISHATAGDVKYECGIIVGLASLVGVYVGIYFKDKIDLILQRKLLVIFYFMILVYLAKRIFF